jgi:hypothetical protein
MNDKAGGALDTGAGRRIDWKDVRFTFFLAGVFMLLKWTNFTRPEWHLNTTDALVPFLLTLGYIVARARRQPEKLDEWGITTPLTFPAVALALALFGVGVGVLTVSTGIAFAGGPRFEPSYVPRMVDYIVGAFPQQFVMCSVGLVSLAKLRPFRNTWMLALAVGLAFCLAHFLLPGKALSTMLLELATLFPAGFLAAGYFLKFRNLLPLTAMHAALFVLLSSWTGWAVAHQ